MDKERVIDMVNDDKMEELKKAFAECMELWEIMSALEDMDIKTGGSYMSDSKRFKDMVLREIMGIDDYNSGCPFCERYINVAGCDECPIHSEVESRIGESLSTFACFETEYKVWDEAANEEGKHVQKFAQDFFDYLFKLLVSVSG